MIMFHDGNSFRISIDDIFIFIRLGYDIIYAKYIALRFTSTHCSRTHYEQEELKRRSFFCVMCNGANKAEKEKWIYEGV